MCSYSFLDSGSEKPTDMNRKMKRQHGDTCIWLRQVYECHRKFKSEVLNLVDAARSGRVSGLALTLMWNNDALKQMNNNR